MIRYQCFSHLPIYQYTSNDFFFKKLQTCSRYMYVSMILHLPPCQHPESLKDISVLPCLLSLSLSLSICCCCCCCSLSSRQQLLLLKINISVIQDLTNLVQHPERTSKSEQLRARFRPGILGSASHLGSQALGHVAQRAWAGTPRYEFRVRYIEISVHLYGFGINDIDLSEFFEISIKYRYIDISSQL